MTLGILVSFFILALATLLGASAVIMSTALVLVGLGVTAITVLRHLPKGSKSGLGVGDTWRIHWFVIVSLVMVAVPFLPLIALGPTYWTLTSNDFPWFLGHAAVWETGSSEEFIARHPDSWGSRSLATAYIEKPIATSALIFGTKFAFAPAPAIQTSLMMLTTIGTTLFVLMGLRNLMGSIRPWMSAAVVVATIGLYPWARILHGQWGHVLALWALAGSLYWMTRLAGSSRPSSVRVTCVVSGMFAGLAFGSNPELVTLLAPSILVFVMLIYPASAVMKRYRGLLLWLLGAVVVSAPFVSGAYKVSLRFLSLPLEQLVQLRPQIPPPSPLGIVGIQTAYDSVTPRQSLVLWGLVFLMVVLPLFRMQQVTRFRVILLGGALIANVGLVASIFGLDDYSTGKVISALIPLSALPAISIADEVGVKPGWANGTWLFAVVAVSIAFVYAGRMPFVIPRDLISLHSNQILSELDLVDVNLGNYYENDTAVLVIPSRSIRVIDSVYGGETSPSGAPMLVRLEQAGSLDGVIELNDHYGLKLHP